MMETLLILAQLYTAQPMPRTVTVVDDSGKPVATATINGTMTVYRSLEGELMGSSTIDAQGNVNFYDVHGKLTAWGQISRTK